jgi:hypothetical protein
MKTMDRERRDWGLLIFIVPLGILLMIIAGQIAIRVMPHWSVNAGMQSRLDPNSASSQPISLFQPILPQILTPMAWAESYLTPVRTCRSRLSLYLCQAPHPPRRLFRRPLLNPPRQIPQLLRFRQSQQPLMFHHLLQQQIRRTMTDTNTNVDINTLPPEDTNCPADECDNRAISTGNLYQDPDTGVSTGILIDVDNAPSSPPAGTYDYIVIISPSNDSDGEAQIDAIVVTEVPISPTP